MKKYAKIVALILTIFTLCTILCSCDALDEMKAEHGVKQENGTILLQGNVYEKISYKVKINFDALGGLYDHVFVTEKDVPVLFSRMLGELCIITRDRGLIKTDNEIYVIKEKREQVEKEAKEVVNGNYSIFFMNAHDDFEEKWGTMCTAEEVKMLNEVVSEENIIPYVESYNIKVNIYCSTESGYFKNHYGYLACLPNGKYGVYRTPNGELGNLYLVPEKYQKTFEKLYYESSPRA